MNPFQQKPGNVADGILNWSSVYPTPYNKMTVDPYSLFNPQELCYNEKNATAPQWTRIFSLSACFYSLLRQEKGGSLHV